MPEIRVSCMRNAGFEQRGVFMAVGIESINLYGGLTVLDIRTLFQARNLDMERFDNLMIEKKSVGLPCEDPVTNAVNAAKPIIDQLTEDEKNRIETVIASTESGLDFGKALSTYVHDYLGLSRRCRLFEVKQACYGGTAALQTAINMIASGTSPGAKILVVATDVARSAARYTYAEPSQAVGAVAMLVSDQPDILEIDLGANGLCGYEVMDTCRPQPEIELGNADISLLSYMDCLDQAFAGYVDRVEGADFLETFQYLAFHTPFAGMVKGAHRKMMRKLYRAKKPVIEADFMQRVGPSLTYCQEVGNIYSATLYAALCGVIDNADLSSPKRLGLFSYGSGCSSEFFSGILTSQSREKLGKMKIKQHLANRHQLNMEEYDRMMDTNAEWLFGLKDKETDISNYADIYAKQMEGRGLLMLRRIKEYHREYEWS